MISEAAEHWKKIRPSPNFKIPSLHRPLTGEICPWIKLDTLDLAPIPGKRNSSCATAELDMDPFLSGQNAKCVKEILGGGGQKNEVRGTKFSWCLCLKCFKTHLHASLIPNFFQGDTPGLPLKRGRSRMGRKGEERRGKSCVMAVGGRG